MAAEPLEVRIAKLEGAYEQLDKRVDEVRVEVQTLRSEMRAEFNAVRTEFANLRGEMRQQFFWLLGAVLLGIIIPIVTSLAQ